MRLFKTFCIAVLVSAFSFSIALAAGQDYSGNEDPNKKILKQGLLGAGVGAISAEASGGKAGTGALVGAGTSVIGGALLDTLTAPSAPQPQQVQYVQQAPQYVQQSPQYAQSYPVQSQAVVRSSEPMPVYVQQAPVYQKEDPNKKIIKSGLLGAGVGAISASASGGKAGKGALIGAGTNVIGGALLDSLFSSPQQQQQPVYYQQQPVQYQQPIQYQNTSASGTQPKKKIIRTYDSDGKIKSETEVWE